MKVDISKPCDNKTCAGVQKSASFKQTYEDTDIIEIPVQETHSKLVNSKQKLTGIKNMLDDVSPIVTKTSSGDLKVSLDKEIVKLIDKKMQDNPNLFVELAKTNSGEISVDLHKDRLSCNTNKVLAKKTPSGNIILEFDREVGKNCISSFAKPTNKEKTIDQCCSTDKVLSQENLTNSIILNTTNKKISGCRIQSKNTNNLLKVRVKRNNNTPSEVLFAIRQIDFGVYKLILDKEFEKWYLQTINDHYIEKEDAYFRIEKSNSGHFIMNIDDQCDSDNKNAVLVRSHSGNNIKLVFIENRPETKTIKNRFGSVISPRILSGFMNDLPHSCIEIESKDLIKSRIISTKSSSDSNVYGRVKFDIRNNQNLIESEAVLKKTNSGQYTVVLDKESKSAFINNLKKTISSSSKGLLPIKRTSSGNIIIDLNSDLTSQYGSLKVTKSGNMYVLLKNNIATGITKNTERSESLDKTPDKESILSQNLYKAKKVSSKATTTNCKGQCSETSCDESKCICDSNDYDSKEWVVGNAEIFFENKGFATNTLINSYSNIDFKSKDKLIKNSPHIVIKPCGCRPILEKPSIDGYGAEVQSICPYHIDRYQELSNEILEISGLCQRNLDVKEYNEKHEENRTHTHGNKKILDWDSLQFLPPQLPLFLKDYSLL